MCAASHSLPRLTELLPTARQYRDYLDALAEAGFGGDIHRDAATRLVTATDNSVYQLLPQAVIYPRTADDVALALKTAAAPAFAGVTFAPRGGGTGTNGQSLSEGVIIDVSRHMNRIGDLDLEAGWVEVEPGVVLDQLNAHLAPHGVFFAPNLSPASRATLGGMIATDAAGKGSRIYGKTSQHVLALDVVLADGTPWHAESLSDSELLQARARPDRIGEALSALDNLVTENSDRIAETFPRLDRFLTGYNLAGLRTVPGRFDPVQILTGSEGTLAVLTGARLRLSPIPPHSALVVLKYRAFEDALGSAERVVASNPAAIETIDERVLGLAKRDVIWHAVGHLLDDGDGPHTAAVNLVEYEGNDPAAVEAQAVALIASVTAMTGAKGYAHGYVRAATAQESAALWSLRKKGVGLLGNLPGWRQPSAFVEDTVVPPERLKDYVRDFRAILDEYGLTYGMFGHIDVGCLHVRPALDMKEAGDERLLREISDRVVRLVKRYGGLIWGEHGKGMRSEYNPEFFGPELYRVLCDVKAAFDPTGKLNPGKLAIPTGTEGTLRSVDSPKRGAHDRQIPPVVREHFAEVIRCNGNGQCFDWDPDHVMCPSSKATRARIHSPKGRAGVMREWLRQLSGAGVDPKGLLTRGGVGWRPTGGGFDYSHEVYRAMDGCLACKACATRCPIKVDVPAFRAEFLAIYHQRYRRPLSDWLIASLEGMVSKLARFPRLANALGFNRLARGFLRRVVGIVDPPPLSVPNARTRLAQRGVPGFELARFLALPEAERRRTVLIMPDAFTSFHEAQVLAAAVDVLSAVGYRPEILPFCPSGKGAHVKGFLKRFERAAHVAAAHLEALAALQIPILGLDPAVVLVFRDEVPRALGRPMTVRVQLFQEWLSEAPLTLPAGLEAGSWTLMGHCTERTAEPRAMAQWKRVFERFGGALDVPELGCCGMCGAFGHERRHLEESRGVFDLSWGRRLPSAPAGRAKILATGHSCRSQVKRFGGFRPHHPLEILAATLHGAAGRRPRNG